MYMYVQNRQLYTQPLCFSFFMPSTSIIIYMRTINKQQLILPMIRALRDVSMTCPVQVTRFLSTTYSSCFHDTIISINLLHYCQFLSFLSSCLLRIQWPVPLINHYFMPIQKIHTTTSQITKTLLFL